MFSIDIRKAALLFAGLAVIGFWLDAVPFGLRQMDNPIFILPVLIDIGLLSSLSMPPVGKYAQIFAVIAVIIAFFTWFLLDYGYSTGFFYNIACLICLAFNQAHPTLSMPIYKIVSLGLLFLLPLLALMAIPSNPLGSVTKLWGVYYGWLITPVNILGICYLYFSFSAVTKQLSV